MTFSPSSAKVTDSAFAFAHRLSLSVPQVAAYRRRSSVAYSLNCKDTGADCGFAVTAETEDEVMQHVATHAAAAHPDLELTPETVANVKSHIQKS